MLDFPIERSITVHRIINGYTITISTWPPYELECFQTLGEAIERVRDIDKKWDEVDKKRL